MITGTGVDLIEIDRIADLGRRYGDRFFNRMFTEAEIAHCSARKSCYQHYAARFAVKEAVFKALGTGWSQGVGWKQIETTNDVSGRPLVTLRGRAKELADEMDVQRVHVSISHSQKFAIAQIVLEA